MHDIYPFTLPVEISERLWSRFWLENPDRRVSWYRVHAVVKSPIHIEFAVYGSSYGDLRAEISHSYSDTILYPFIAAEQRRVAERVLAERERLAAALELERKLAAVHQELFGEPLQPTNEETNP
jgi:hypothetical protein